MTKLEKDHLAAVAALGCIACHIQGFGHTPSYLTAIHHVRRDGERRNHFRVLPLCGAHHQNGGHGVAVHAGEKTWEQIYGGQEVLLAYVELALLAGDLSCVLPISTPVNGAIF